MTCLKGWIYGQFFSRPWPALREECRLGGTACSLESSSDPGALSLPASWPCTGSPVKGSLGECDHSVSSGTMFAFLSPMPNFRTVCFWLLLLLTHGTDHKITLCKYQLCDVSVDWGSLENCRISALSVQTVLQGFRYKEYPFVFLKFL